MPVSGELGRETPHENEMLRGRGTGGLSLSPWSCERQAPSYRPGQPVKKHPSKAQDASGCGFKQSPSVACHLPLGSLLAELHTCPSQASAVQQAASVSPGNRGLRSTLAWPYPLKAFTWAWWLGPTPGTEDRCSF